MGTSYSEIIVLASILITALLACGVTCACEEGEGEPLKHALTLPLDFDSDEGHKPVYAVAFSPDSNLLAVGGSGSTVRLHQVPMGHVKLTLQTVQRSVHALVFSRDGKALSCGAGTWDLASGRETRLSEALGGANSVAFSRDEKMLAVGRYYRESVLWNLETQKQVSEFDPFAGAGRIDKGLYKPTTYAMEITHDGKLLVATVDFFDDELPQFDLVQLWDLETRELVKAFRGASASISPDGKTLAYYHDKMVRLLDLNTLELKRGIASPRLNRLVWSPDGKRIAGKAYDKAIHMIDLATGKHGSQPACHRNYIYCIAFSPDGKWLASGSGEGSVKLWAAGDVENE